MISGQDGYTGALDDMTGARGVGEATEEGANTWAVLYFVGVLFLLSFVLLGEERPLPRPCRAPGCCEHRQRPSIPAPGARRPVRAGVTFYHFSQLKAERSGVRPRVRGPDGQAAGVDIDRCWA